MATPSNHATHNPLLAPLPPNGPLHVPPCTCLHDFNQEVGHDHPNPEGMQEYLSGPHPCPFRQPGPLLSPTQLEPPETDPQIDRSLLSDLAWEAQRDRTSPQQTDADRAAARIHDPGTLSTTFRHSGWTHDRQLVARSMARTEQPLARRSEFAGCGSHAYVIRSLDNPALYRIAGSACHDRFCLPCATERARGIALNVIEHVAGREVRFLTLTLKHTDRPLPDQLDHLYKSFSDLRRRTFWKRRVTGGIAFLEVVLSESDGLWHPHLHILIEGSYIPKRELSSLWCQITDGSFIVKIKAVKDNRKCASYVTKYASKPFNNSFIAQADALDEAVAAFKGRKLLMTFGTWRGLQLVEKPDDAAWEHVAPLEVVIFRAAHGDAEARSILASLTDADLSPLFARAPPKPPPAEPDPPKPSQLTFAGAWQSDGYYL